MATLQSQVQTAIESIRRREPALADGLTTLANSFFEILEELHPSTSGIQRRPGGVSPGLGVVTNFQVLPYPTNLFMSWDDIANGFRYEIRQGLTWETAIPLLITGSNAANFNPQQLNLIYGTYTFLIKPIDINGLYGADASSATLSIPQILAPTLTVGVISNNVILNWSIPSSVWQIAYYKIYKDDIEVGQINGTFKIQAETVSGTYTYKVRAYDVVGNASLDSQEFTVFVNAPIDFVQVGNIPSAYNGTEVNTRVIDYNGIQAIIGAIIEETWEDHYIDNSWDNVQEQVDAGFPKYYQPSFTSGTYQEVFDFGLILSNVNVTTIFNKTTVAGSVNLSVDIEVSDDGISWSSPVTGTSIFVLSVRYVRITITFTNADDLSAAIVSGLRVVADVQFTVDSGSATLLASDATGTEIFYNVTFRQVNSATATIESVQPITVIVDTASITATSFRALAFDSSGNRIDATVSWKARGIV